MKGPREGVDTLGQRKGNALSIGGGGGQCGVLLDVQAWRSGVESIAQGCTVSEHSTSGEVPGS